MEGTKNKHSLRHSKSQEKMLSSKNTVLKVLISEVCQSITWNQGITKNLLSKIEEK